MLRNSRDNPAAIAVRYESAGRSAESGHITINGAADYLSLAAAPVFAMMALLTIGFGGSRSGVLCAVTHVASPLGGMMPMYLLMSAFHSAPWLRLVGRRRC